MSDELGAISVGLGVNLGTLKADIAAANREANNAARTRFIEFRVGRVNFRGLEREIARVAATKVNVNPTFTVSRGNARELRAALQAQLKTEGPIPVQIKANLSSVEVSRIRNEIIRALGQIPLHVTVSGATGGAPAAPTPRQTAAPPPAVAPVARSRPVPPGVASSGVVAAPATPRAAPPPVFSEQLPATKPTSGSTAAFLRRQAEKRTGRRLGPDELAAQKRRVAQPETPEEIEYGSRPAATHIAPDEQTQYEQEKRGRGVRGASRSGARLRNEPVLTDADRLATENASTAHEFTARQRRSGEIAEPARKSSAYYGRTRGRLARAMEGIQFYKFDPVLGESFAALQSGDDARARELLKGFSARLAGADPRKRKRFFKIFRNIENVPEELLEKDAALRALFAQIHSNADPSYTNLKSANTIAGGGGKPKGTVAQRATNPIDRAIEELNAGSITREEFERRFPHLRRAAGGPVSGGLMARIAAQKAKEQGYLVGEQHPEWYVGKSGKAQVVGKNGPEVRSFPEDGRIEPRVPEWIRRGMAKDLTGRAAGGPVRGVGGRFRPYVEGEAAAVAGGLLGRGDAGSVQRVFVTNWPAGAASFTSSPAGAGIAAGPLTGLSGKGQAQFASQLAKQIGANIQQILAATSAVNAAPPGAGAGGETTTGALGPFEKQQARQAANRATTGLEQRVGAARAATAESQQLIPVRSLSVAVGQIFSTVFGGRGDAISRAKEANALAARATSAVSNFRTEEKKLLEITAKLDQTQDPAKQKALIDHRREQAKATQLAYRAAKDLTGQAEEASQKIIGQAGALRNLAAGTVGVVAGTLAFSTALGIAQAGIGVFSAVFGPAAERLTGFTATSARVTSQLADQVKQQSGATQTAIAAAAAEAGLSKSTEAAIGPLLAQRAATEAGNKTLQQGLDLLHAFEDARKRGGQQGLTSTTGGLLGSFLGGTASTQEIIKNELTASEATLTPQERAQRNAAQAGQASTRQTFQGRAGFGTQTIPVGETLAATQGKVDILNDRLSFFNDALGKGGSKLKFMANASDDVAKAFASAAEKAGATELAGAARSDNHVVLVDPSGKPILDKQSITDALSAVNTGVNTPDPALLIKQLTERIIPAQKAQFRAEGNLQRNLINPAQAALGEAASPTPGIGNTPFNAGLVGKGDAAGAAAASKYRKEVGGAVNYVNDQIAKGREALMNLVPPDLQQEFGGILNEITATGAQITKIQSGIQQQQVNLQVAEYNNQLRIARRSLQDARDLQAGISGATRDTLGSLEGQNIVLQRQLQLLGFELQQRQINLKVALAGFVAPGSTPEERAARIEEAKIEAAFAQKQLDIQKQLASNQQKAIRIEASRSVVDLVNQIGLLAQGRTVTINTAAASRALDILNKKQQLLTQQAGTYIEEGVKVTQAAIAAGAQVVQQTGKDFSYVLGQTANAWGIFGKQASAILAALKGTAPGSTSYATPNNPSGPSRPYATGILGDTSGATGITVGEAGHEKVAILKHPRLLHASAAGGWGGAPQINLGGITVVIQGGGTTDESTMERLAAVLQRKIEERMSLKLSLLGARSPVGG